MSWKYFLWGEEKEAPEIYIEHAKTWALKLQSKGRPKAWAFHLPV